MYKITQLKVDLQGMLHGVSLSKVQGVNDLIQRAGRELLSDLDPMETQRTADLGYQLVDGSLRYACPEDLKKDKVIDIRPIEDRSVRDSAQQGLARDFDKFKARNTFKVEYNNGVKTILFEPLDDTVDYEVVYYSRFLFKELGVDDAPDTWKETVDDDEDVVNLETDAYNLLLNKTMILVAPQVQDRAAGFDMAFYQSEYQNGLKKYKGDYKSEVLKKRNFYY